MTMVAESRRVHPVLDEGPGALAHGGPAVIRCLVHPAEVAILDRFRSQRRCLRAGGLRAPEVTLHEEKISSLRLRR
jgi:hypothetical protein